MRKKQFLKELEDNLYGLPKEDIKEISKDAKSLKKAASELMGKFRKYTQQEVSIRQNTFDEKLADIEKTIKIQDKALEQLWKGTIKGLEELATVKGDINKIYKHIENIYKEMIFIHKHFD